MASNPVLVVAGGAGFIGANFVHYIARTRPDWTVRIVDLLTYAGDRTRLAGADAEFIQGDIANGAQAAAALDGAAWLVNFAAETHVDRSLLDADAFLRTNVSGAHVLLQAARAAGIEKIVHVSTDEVYGESRSGVFTETDLLAPRSPYSASKAGGEMQAFALHATYGLPVCVTRGANTIGPWQHPEKAVPLFTINALTDQPLPLYGRGEQQRDRLHVNDHCGAILAVLERGVPGEVYNVAADNHRDNLTVARAICRQLGKPESLIRFVEDRAGHDWNYAMDATKLRGLGWAPESDFDQTLGSTVDWYAAHRAWWEPIVGGEFQAYYETQYGRRLAESEAYRA